MALCVLSLRRLKSIKYEKNNSKTKKKTNEFVRVGTEGSSYSHVVVEMKQLRPLLAQENELADIPLDMKKHIEIVKFAPGPHSYFSTGEEFSKWKDLIGKECRVRVADLLLHPTADKTINSCVISSSRRHSDMSNNFQVPPLTIVKGKWSSPCCFFYDS